MDLFRITDNKIQATNQLDRQLLLDSPEKYVFLLSYKELAIMRMYLRQLARGRSFDDVCNKCDVVPLIVLGATIIAHPAYICAHYVPHDSMYMYMQVAPEGTGDKALRVASELVKQVSERTSLQEQTKQQTPPAEPSGLIARIWQLIRKACRYISKFTRVNQES